MLGKLRNPFREGRRKASSENGMELIGLRLLTQTSNSKPKSNVLVKSALIKVNQTIPVLQFCFLQTCNLCKKQLTQDKDIYMYRGNEGFCSIECRNRQIVLDELEKSSKPSNGNRHCWNDARRETRLILQDLTRSRLQSNQTPPRQIFLTQNPSIK